MEDGKIPSRTRLAARTSLPAQRAGRWRVWLAVTAVVVTALVVVRVADLGQGGSDPEPSPTASAAPQVGGDLHAVAAIDSRRFVSGHEGAALSDAVGVWEPIPGLSGKDGMGWAAVPGAILVGGHAGLYASVDGGETFAEAGNDLPVTDVHALGAAGKTVYVASPQGGLFVSTDGGQTFDARSDAGASFMGSMIVDSGDPDHAIAPDMANGLVETRDGGSNWRPMGGPEGAVSVAWDPTAHERIVAVGMDGAAIRTDAGGAWTSLDAPANTMAATFDEGGRLLATVLEGTAARVYLSADGGETWTRV